MGIQLAGRPRHGVGMAVGQRTAQTTETDGVGVGTGPAQQRGVSPTDEHRHRLLHRAGAGELDTVVPTSGVGGHGSTGQQVTNDRRYRDHSLNSAGGGGSCAPSHLPLCRGVPGADT